MMPPAGDRHTNYLPSGAAHVISVQLMPAATPHEVAAQHDRLTTSPTSATGGGIRR